MEKKGRFKGKRILSIFFDYKGLCDLHRISLMQKSTGNFVFFNWRNQKEIIKNS